MPTIEEHVTGQRFDYRPVQGNAINGWVVPIQTALPIKKGRKVQFGPPIGASVGEPHPFRKIAREYGGQSGEVLDARVKGTTHYDLLVKFADGSEHWLWTEYLFALPEVT